MPAKKQSAFNPQSFLSTIGKGRTLESFPKKSLVFVQGEATDGLFFIQIGKVRLNVVSEGGKEATLGILSEGDFWRRRARGPAPTHVLGDRRHGQRTSPYR
jgi:CRP-like cAMP-binding protein